MRTLVYHTKLAVIINTLGQMVVVKIRFIWWLIFIVIVTFGRVQSGNVTSKWCPSSVANTTMKPKTCHHSQVPVPIPFECDTIPVNCHDVENLLESNKSIKAYMDGQGAFGRHVIVDCTNDTTSVKSGHWKIELNQMKNVYAVLIRTVGQTKGQSNIIRVSVTRQISSKRLETIKCHDFYYFDGYHHFYCYPTNGTLTSDYRLGFDTHFVDISGSIYIDSCALANIVKIYSYPIMVCGPPESHHNQSINPKAYYYLVGQQVVYMCSDESYTLIGSPNRVCQLNGLWSGETPICILVENFKPKTRLVYFAENPSSDLYFSSNSLVNATRINEHERITYGFDAEYCIKNILLEFHSELSERTHITLYTTSNDGTRHIWATNGSFGEYSNKQYFFSNGHEEFVCTHNVTLQRHRDIPLTDFFKRIEYIYKIEIAGYRKRGMDCLRPHILPNVKFVANPNSTIETGMTIALECKKGFRLTNRESDDSDPAAIHCVNGVWNGALPICERQHCPQPIERDHSSWDLVENSKIKYNKVHYKCDAGFESKGSNTATCFAGKWTAPPPVCQVNFCPRIFIPTNMYCMLNRKTKFYDEFGNGTSYHHGIGLNCYCLPGFRLIGNQTIQCSNKEWTSDLPSCQEIFCYKPPFLSSSSKYGIMKEWRWRIGPHNFTCPETLIVKELECQENGEWSETEVYECVKPGYITCEQVAGIVVGVFLGVMFIFISFYILVERGVIRSCKENWKKRKFKKIDVNSTISEDCSYIKNYMDVPNDNSFDTDADSLTKSTDPIALESSDSDEIEVV